MTRFTRLFVVAALCVFGYSAKPSIADGPGLGGGYLNNPADALICHDGPGNGGGYLTSPDHTLIPHDGPGLGGGY